MEDNSEYKNGFPPIDITKDSVLNMLTKVASFKMEERDLALDRFKRINEEMGDDAQFWAHGKNAILYLDSASKSSNYLGDLARDVMKVVFKEEAGADNGSGSGLKEDDKKKLEQIAAAFMSNRRKKDTNNSAAPSSTDEV